MCNNIININVILIKEMIILLILIIINDINDNV